MEAAPFRTAQPLQTQTPLSSPPPKSALQNQTLQTAVSPHFADWLQQQHLSLAFTTYQTNRLFCVGTNSAGRVALHERLFDKPMGLFSQGDRLYMSTRYQLWELANLLAPGEVRQGCDRLYSPKVAHTTGDLNVHDVVVDGVGDTLFVNTDFSCLARLSDNYSFEPIWQPPFISKLVAEDRCHLNGLAMRKGKPAYMSACSSTDKAAGWRDHRVDGGVIIDVQSNNIVARGLSMPHSPRWYQGKLWVLNSGSGELGHIDFASGKFVPLTFCPGFVRGLAFHDNYAFVGLSKLRSRPFTGLSLETKLTALGDTPHCGLMVIDLTTGQIIHSLQFEGVVEELFDVVVLPGVHQPQSLGFQSDEIERLITFPGADEVVTTKPTVNRPSLGSTVPIAGVPRELWEGEALTQPAAPVSTSQNAVNNQDASKEMVENTTVKFQNVYHLTPENLLAYDEFTFPSLQQRWQTQSVKGELIGVSASANGSMVAFAIADITPSSKIAEIISLFVAPAYRRQRIGSRLIANLEKALKKEGCVAVAVAYSPTLITQQALEPLLKTLDWQTPQLMGDQKRSAKQLVAPPITAPLVTAPSVLKSSEIAIEQFEQGKKLFDQGDFLEAIAHFKQAIQSQPNYIAAYNKLGNAYQQIGEFTPAIAAYQTLLKLDPNVAQAHSNLGAVFQIQGETNRAISSYQQAIVLKPNFSTAHLNLAKLLVSQHKLSLACYHYQAAIEATTAFVQSQTARLQQNGIQSDKSQQYRAQQNQKQQIEAYQGLGQTLLDQGLIDSAEACFHEVLNRVPDDASALFALGRIAEAQGKPEKSLERYQQLFDHHAEWRHVAAYQLGYAKRQLCDWQDDDILIAELRQRIGMHIIDPDSSPLPALSLSIFSDSPELHLAVNQHYAKRIAQQVQQSDPGCTFDHAPALASAQQRLKIGYVSPDFCNHPVGWLVQDTFEHFDRDRFSIVAYSLRQVEDAVQTKIKANCDEFVNCSQLSSAAIAHQIHADGIHILIDLAGYTTYSRPEVFALRPAPVQCSYLGYPDTTGAPWIDYLLTDEQVVPSELAQYCSEEVVYLPHQFVVSPQFGVLVGPSQHLDNPSSLPQLSASKSQRADYGLPEEGFVFCCFNAHRKIDPVVFATWMQILKQVPGSVLWLLDGPAAVKHNLQQAAASLGVAPQRLVFSAWTPFEQYLARYSHADLYLDTFTYGAGSTGVCALANGVPLLTRAGNTNAARMGSSLCSAVALDWLICQTTEEYVKVAVQLASNPDSAAMLRQQLQENRDELALFQPQQWVKTVEVIFQEIWERSTNRVCAGKEAR